MKTSLVGGLLSLGLFGAVIPGATEVQAVSLLPRKLSICDDDAERPPFIYFRRQLGVRTEELTGFSVDLLRRVLDAENQAYQLELLPWKRCLSQVQQGSYDMVLSMSRGGDRESRYRFSQAISVSRLVYFYDLDLPVPRVDKAEDLLKHKLCLVNGVNYQPFGVAAGEPAFTGTAKTLGQTFLMLKSRRCELVPARLEGAIGYRLLGMADYEQLGLGFRPVPGLTGQSLHFGVSAKLPQAQALIERLDAGIERLRASGELAELADRYGLGRSLP